MKNIYVAIIIILILAGVGWVFKKFIEPPKNLRIIGFQVTGPQYSSGHNYYIHKKERGR